MNRFLFAALLTAGLGAFTRLNANPLVKAAGYGKPEEVKSLLDRGADVNGKDQYGATALMRAASGGRGDVAKLLLDRGARVEEKDAYGKTALQAAASSGSPEMIRLLLGRGADILAVDSFGASALHTAAGMNKINSIEALLDKKCDVDLADRDGRTPLAAAASSGRVEAVKLLLSRGAKIDAKDSRGRTALIAAASGGHLEAAGALLDGGADLAAADDSGAGALHAAAKYEKAAVVRLLIEKGASAKAKNKYGETALFLAAAAGYTEIVELLLKHGAELDGPNNDGLTPLMAAARRGRSAATKALATRGANIDAVSRLGQTAAALAEKEGHAELATWLKGARPGLAASAAPRPAQRPRVSEQTVYSSDVDKPGYKAPPNPDNYAVLVGIEDYADLPPAQFAERDAAAVREHLVALGYPLRNIVLVAGARASRAGLVKNVENWLPKNVNERSTVFFYYSGHGAPDPASGDAYLVPADGDPQYLEETAYPIKRLYEKLSALKAKRIIVVLDSCFSGAGGRSVLAKGTRPLVNKIEFGAAATGRVVSMTASKADQISGSLEEQGHGLFTYYLLRGLNGDAKAKGGEVTVRSLYEYLSPNVQDAAHRANREQKPQLILGASAGDGGIRLR
ncbi:MAG: ankyrin repeat domain-containing protein [Elusimicrobiota bacterium]